MVKKTMTMSRFHLIPERHGRTDRRTDRIPISISRVSVLTCDKKLVHGAIITESLVRRHLGCPYANKMSSAYSTMYVPKWTLNNLPTSSTYTAKRYGERTDPCLTPEETLNANDQLQCHLTHAKQLEAPHFTLVKEALIEIGCVVTSLVVGWLVGCHARALWPNGAS